MQRPSLCCNGGSCTTRIKTYNPAYYTRYDTINYKKMFVWLSALGIAIGLGCRLLIFNISYEYDEIFTAVTSNPTVPLGYIWKNYLLADVHPPLHNILLWIYNHWAPYGPEWSLRWPSLILSVASLFLAWKLFPRYLGKIARWIFVLLLSCNFYLLLYAQHARAYSLLICLAVVLTYLYLQIARCLHHKHAVSREIWIWYGICSLLLCWSHYFGALLFGLFSVILLIIAWKHKQPLRYCITVPLLVLAGFLPWLIPNLLENLSQRRFSGNWWGNQALLAFSETMGGVFLFFCQSVLCIIEHRYRGHYLYLPPPTKAESVAF